MNAWLKEQVKSAFLKREIVCERMRKPCRFAIPGYCLQELKDCDYFLPAIDAPATDACKAKREKRNEDSKGDDK